MQSKFCGIGGVNAHDANLCLIDEYGDIEFASMAERFSRTKHDKRIPRDLWAMYDPTFYQLWQADIWQDRLDLLGITYEDVSKLQPAKAFESHPINMCGGIGHHRAHAASAFYTRPWDSVEDTVMVVIDGVGEAQCMMILDHNFKVIEEAPFPISIGYLWAFLTERCGLVSNSDEYVTMGLASYGEPTTADMMYDMFINIPPSPMGIGERGYMRTKEQFCTNIIRKADNIDSNEANLAASLQHMTNRYIMENVMPAARKHGSKLCYSGGVAQNIVTNTLIAQSGMFDDVWIDVNPGDGGNALGVAAFMYNRNTGCNIKWKDPYLGYNIDRELYVPDVVDYILDKKICGVANGRAEYSPRALGNRSLLADPRFPVKDTVNTIKRRQKYRPFAPAILAEHAHEYFEGPMNEYMQYTAKALHDYDSVTHVDGTARVQLVTKDCTSVLRPILEEFYDRTGVPMLLNTSLNVRGEPMVNTVEDARDFERKYRVKVF